MDWIPVEKEDPNRCTKDDEYQTHPCTCPACNGSKDYIQKAVVVTDADMIPEEVCQWVGYTFICPVCKELIMDKMKFCPTCGVRVVVHSDVVNAFIKKHTQGDS